MRSRLKYEAYETIKAMFWDFANGSEMLDTEQIEEYRMASSEARAYLSWEEGTRNDESRFYFLIDEAHEKQITTSDLCKTILSKEQNYTNLIKTMRRARQLIFNWIDETADEDLDLLDIEKAFNENLATLVVRYS